MKASREEFFSVISEMEKIPFDPMELVYPKEVPLFEKYDEFLPAELVKKGFAYGILDIEGMRERVREWAGKEMENGCYCKDRDGFSD